MKLKVCGMRDGVNITELIGLAPDYIGMIFYAKSPRYIQKPPKVKWPEDLQRVGVFVNPTLDEVLNTIRDYKLDLVQLHGGESLGFVKDLYAKGIKIMKVFSVVDHLPLNKMKPYEPYVEYFLFDTKTPVYGGSGKKFNWSILNEYDLTKPYFLSGGIELEDVEAIKALQQPKLYAIDVNSRFEIEPGLKDINKIKELTERL